MPVPSQKPPLTIEHALLGLIAQHPVHAYDLAHQLAQADGLGLIWRLKQGHLYALLARLEADGLLAGEISLQGTRPPRRVLHVTEAGMVAFRTWSETPVRRARAFRQEFLAKLFFAMNEGPEAEANLCERQRLACEARKAELQTQLTALVVEQIYARRVITFRLAEMDGILAWLDTLITSSLFAFPS